MNRRIFTYLRNKGWTDINIVNRLFVSAFLRHYNLVPQYNKLLVKHYIKDNDKESKALTIFITQLKENEFKYTLEELIQLFEFVISPSDRKITGAIYTPKYIREKILNEITTEYSIEKLSTARFADISCGCGSFFLSIARLIHRMGGRTFYKIFKYNLYGVDTQEYSILRTQLLLSLLALINGEDKNFEFNLYQANSLSFNFDTLPEIDFIVGNPPYVCVRNMTEENKKLLGRWSVSASGNSDLYIPFFQIAIEKVKENGKVGFITMNSFLTSLNGRALRKYFQEKSYKIEIVDFRGHQIFPGRNTYTCLFFLTKTQTPSIGYCTNPDKYFPHSFKFEYFDYKLLDAKLGWKLNFLNRNIKIEQIGIPLGQYCQIRHGIATLANNIYVFQLLRREDDNLVFLKEGIENKVEKKICKRIINSNKLNSNTCIENIIEYVIYPYQVDANGKAILIDEKDLKNKFPLAYSYLWANRMSLKQRDKGHTEKYPIWYAYGRTQSLVMPKYKLFFPKIANKRLHCVLSDDEELLLYNGIAFVSDDLPKLKVLKRIMESSIFWDYITLNGKPYSSGYYALNGVNIKNFGIYNFNSKQINNLLMLTQKEEIDTWLKYFYE